MGLSASAELLVLSAFVIRAINRSRDGLMAGEVTTGWMESNGALLPGLWLWSPAG